MLLASSSLEETVACQTLPYSYGALGVLNHQLPSLKEKKDAKQGL